MLRHTFVLIIFVVNLFGQQPDLSFKVMTLNVRYDNPKDSLNAWVNRKALVARLLKEERAHIAGFQEAQFHQLQFLDSVMTQYQFYGVGRDDGQIAGEFSPIFFRKDRFLLCFARTFWLSPTPDVPGSIGKGAVLPRIMTLVRLFDIRAGRALWVVNTHFSHVSDSARLQAAKIILQKSKMYAQDEPLIVMGDFNSEQQSAVYRLFTENKALPLTDTFFAAQSAHSGGKQTFNAFGKTEKPLIIDHIFCSGHFKVRQHYFRPLKSNGLFVSDHFPVLTVLEWQKQ
ncbi:Endonuclease/exonuclease/phosphatase [Caldithrix abyssi DSM 13497]|uniref:Endonuclease/exonuclease/phosphatase n=1 Tax=Caldithrix abyssi DSM 13497 TaxID=880073 RepID=H1XWQ6_CALAY|nr:endonuclease/exonuclease/phosphatase family protein [Caldithrix abyssi]APF19097.1 Metal-dependent hydrolase, endonuclease/exonuclease/phosphatase family [Caldithrix abyssi DSM 13497]EHO43032.1 Endonuclease/exonuclease/phosphatase [Caldithrix abyssi DSM 13497]